MKITQQVSQKLQPCCLVQGGTSDQTIIIPVTKTTKKLYDFVSTVTGFPRKQIEITSNKKVIPDDQNCTIDNKDLSIGSEITATQTQNSIQQIYKLVIKQ